MTDMDCVLPEMENEFVIDERRYLNGKAGLCCIKIFMVYKN
jgi:hypothetical protein